MLIKWDLFGEEEFDMAINGVRKQDATDDFLGNLYIGHLCFDLKLMDYGTKVVLDADLYIGGIDSGYGYTSVNNLPYENDGGFHAITIENVNDFNSFADFKQYLEKKAIDCINNCGNKIYIEKMNMDTLFNWA